MRLYACTFRQRNNDQERRACLGTQFTHPVAFACAEGYSTTTIHAIAHKCKALSGLQHLQARRQHRSALLGRRQLGTFLLHHLGRRLGGKALVAQEPLCPGDISLGDGQLLAEPLDLPIQVHQTGQRQVGLHAGRDQRQRLGRLVGQ